MSGYYLKTKIELSGLTCSVSTGLPDSNQVFWGYGPGPWDWSKIKVWPKISCIAVDFFLVLDLRDLWRPLKFRILGFLKFYSPYKFFQKKF